MRNVYQKNQLACDCIKRLRQFVQLTFSMNFSRVTNVHSTRMIKKKTGPIKLHSEVPALEYTSSSTAARSVISTRNGGGGVLDDVLPHIIALSITM